MRMGRLRNDSARRRGQAMTEYTVLIAVLVVIIITLGFSFRDKIRALVERAIGNDLTQQFFSPRAMHSFPFKMPK